MAEKLYYYYYRWHLEVDADLDDYDVIKTGMYHSTVITTEDFKTFVSHILPTKELTIKCFDTEEEMREFAKTVGL